MAEKLKSISFVVSQDDIIAIKVKEVADEYKIPLNSAFKVLVINLIKDNQRLVEELNICKKNAPREDIATNELKPTQYENKIESNPVRVVENKPKQQVRDNLKEKEIEIDSLNSSSNIVVEEEKINKKIQDFASMMGV